MSYNINKTDGTLLVTVADGGINSAATTISLIGRDLTHYGEILNENLVHMMENFASTINPNNPLEGQLWYDTGAGELKVYDGSVWSAVAGGGGGGETNTASNVGAGPGQWFKQKTGVDLEFRTLDVGDGLELTTGTNTITLAATMGPVSSTAPAVGEVLKWNGVEWEPAPDDDTIGGGGGDSNIVGEIRMFGGATAPAEWLFCDGSSLDTTTYAALFAVLGYAYGGAGSNFNLPDSRSRAALGAGTGAGLTTRNRGDLSGQESVVLTEPQLASHTHTGGVTDAVGNHTHNINLYGGSGGTNGLQTNADNAGSPVVSSAAGGHSHTIAGIGNAGANQPHENMMPFFVVNYIIYTGV